MSYIKSRKHAPATLAAIAASLAMPVVHADTNAAAPEQKMQEVVVTGQNGSDFQVKKSASDKFTAPLLDTPKAVTVIPTEVISQTGATSLTDALRTVPGITVGAAEGGQPVGDNLFIRGYNAQTDTYIDGIRDSGSQSREIFALEQIEVVKGPNSAYGGRSSAGGSINMVSKTAKAETFSNASVGLGTAKYRRATVDVNRMLGDNAAVRLNLMGHENHVAGHHDEVYGNRWGFAPSVAFGLAGPTKVNLSYYHYRSSELPDAGVPFDNPFTTGANVARNGVGKPVNVPSDTFYGLVDRDFRDTKSDIGTIDIKHEFRNGLAFRNVTRYGKTGNEYVYTLPDDSKGNVVLNGTVWRRHNSRNAETESLANASSLTGSFVAAGIKHSFTTGVEVSRELTDRATYNFNPGTNNPKTKGTNCPTTGAETLYNCTTLYNPNPYDPWTAGQVRSVAPNDSKVHTNTRSAYGFDTIEFNPQWLLNLGLRWDEYRSSLHTNANTAATPVVAAIDAENKSNFGSYQAGLVYKPAANSSIYLSYGTSSTPPGNDGGDGVDGLTVAIQNLKPQDSKNFELGTKWEILARKLSISGAVFSSKMNNARVTNVDGTTANIGKKSVRGVELGVSGALSANWQVFGGYTWLDAELEDNCFVNLGTSAAPNYVTCKGNAFPATPKQSASLWTSYTVMPGLVIGGGVNAVSKVWSNVQNTKFVPGYTRVDAMASYDVNKNISLQLNLQNLTDKLYYDKVGSNHYAGVGVGRTAILTANFRY